MQGALFDAPTMAAVDKGLASKQKLGETTGRPRDTQRLRVYEAERRAFPDYDKPEWTTEEECRTFVGSVLGAPWFRSRWGVRSVEVRFRPGSNAKGSQEGWIQLPPWGYSPHVILHELGHVVTPAQEAGHGAAFCASYLELIRHGVGEVGYRKLRREFIIGNVNHLLPEAKRQVAKNSAAIRQMQQDLERQRLKFAESLERIANLEAIIATRGVYMSP